MSCLCNLSITVFPLCQMHPSPPPKETNPLSSYPRCASPSLVVVAVSVYYLIGPHFYFWQHSGSTMCLTPYKFPAFNILTKILSILSVLNTFFSCFLFFLFARFLVLDLFLINRSCLFWGHNINLVSFFFHVWSRSHLDLFILSFAQIIPRPFF